MEKAILLLSGGLDSATLLWYLKDRYEIHALTVKYGETNRMELQATKSLVKRAAAAEHIIVDMGFLKELDEEKPGGSAELGLPPCYIPARNIIFLGLAAHFAELRGASKIFTGHNIEDQFPDARQGFLDAFNVALAEGLPRSGRQAPRVVAPLNSKSKDEIFKLARELKVPFDLTWSCYTDDSTPCGVCEGCRRVAQSMREAGL